MQKSVFTFVFVLLGVTINLTWRLWVSRYKLINFLSVQQLLVILPQKPTWTGWKLPDPCLIHLEVNKVSILPFIAGAAGGFSGKETAIQPLAKAFASARVISGWGWQGWLSQPGCWCRFGESVRGAIGGGVWLRTATGKDHLKQDYHPDF